MSFPEGFVWGASTSSYQIEGASLPHERGASIWDAFASRNGTIKDGSSGRHTCKHVERVEEDVRLMSDIGLRAYRFSVSWPRVIPNGNGAVNDAGLGFYDRLVDLLLAHGIQPWLTLYHWDLPLELHHKGGWLNRQIVDWFSSYTQVVVDRLSDRVRHWITINEPQIYLDLGYAQRVHAPGLGLSFADQLRASHHALLAHGRAVRVIRERARETPIVGWAPVGKAFVPNTEDSAHVDAVRDAMFRSERSLWSNSWFADPVCLGQYPEDGLRLFHDDVPVIEPGDLELISTPIDFYGMNTYSGERVVVDEQGDWKVAPRAPGFPCTAFGWPIEPDCLYWCPKLLHERYRLPIVVTENGLSLFDAPDLDGRVLDHARVDFLARYLGALLRAIDDGTNVQGYFHWSLLDNFEWAEGYKQRFGLVHVNFETCERTPKLSAEWYAGVIRSNGASLAPLPSLAAGQFTTGRSDGLRPQVKSLAPGSPSNKHGPNDC